MISIITPVFNGSHFMEFCIKNVIEQNCPKAEHIIVDGDSTDGTVDIIRKYAEKYPHIQWISEKDKGQSDAMNKGISMAKGDIIGFLNADDFYEPNILNRVVKLFEGLPKLSLLVANCNIWDDHGRLIATSRPNKINLTNLLLERYVDAFPMNASGYFYHASLHSVIGLYKLDEHFGMDLDFIIRAVQAANVKYVDEIWGNYRYREGTKSYEDSKRDRNTPRVKRITGHYRKQQPLPYRSYLAAVETLGEIMLLTNNILSFLRRR